MVASRMRPSKEICITLLLPVVGVLLIAEVTRGDTLHGIEANREDPCVTLCEKTSADFSNKIYVKSCCQRGCRFFNLVDLRHGWESDELNGTRQACETSCTEAYTNVEDRYICGIGCDFMARQRVLDLLSLLSIAMRVEKNVYYSNALGLVDIPENDILTDPGLRKELLPGWWDSDGFKLPQTYIKTVPMDVGTVDYSLSSDYSGESEQTAFTPVIVSGPDWFKCIFKMPPEHLRPLFFLLIGTFIVLFIILLLRLRWLYVCIEDDLKMTPEEELLGNPQTNNCRKIFLMRLKRKAEGLPVFEEPPPEYMREDVGRYTCLECTYDKKHHRHDQLSDQPEYTSGLKVII